MHGYLVQHVRDEPGEVAAALLDTGIGVKATAVQLGTILVGGIETLPKIIAGAAVRLAGDRAQHAALVAEPAIVPAAFEEIVRLEGVLQSVGRTLVTDTVIGGQPMLAGQRVMLLLQSANRDDREFADAERFDIRRVIPRHVGFGQGTHFSSGSTSPVQPASHCSGMLERYPQFTVDLSGRSDRRRSSRSAGPACRSSWRPDRRRRRARLNGWPTTEW